MSDKLTYRLVHETARKLAATQCMEAPDGMWVIFQDESRTLEQNAYQWPYLEGFAKQLQWPVNGERIWITKEEYKDILTAAFENEVNPRIAAGWDGGVVMLGRKTSQFGKKKFGLWMEWLMAAAALKGVTPIFKNGWRKWQSNTN